MQLQNQAQNKTIVKLTDDEVFESLKIEQKDIGYYSLPFQDLSTIEEFSRNILKTHIVVIGIGGSTLGTYAIYKFLQNTKRFKKKLHFFESTDPLDINARLDDIDLGDSFFLVISKSGNTVETISIFKYIYAKTKIDKTNCAVITQKKSKLDTFASSHEITSFEVPINVGGRYSVFSNVGLVPLDLLGVDINKLLIGTKDAYNDFFNQNKLYTKLLEKARFFVENKENYHTNVLFSYATELEGFNKWYIQLCSESLGKINTENQHQGFTPIGLLGPVDQHSFLQLIVEGKRDKSITFIKIKDFEDKSIIPDIKLEGLESLDYINTIEFEEMINLQVDSTIEAIEELGDIPFEVIELEKIDEYTIGYLMFSYQLFISTVATFLSIDAYNQPGVENEKRILKEKLQTKKGS